MKNLEQSFRHILTGVVISVLLILLFVLPNLLEQSNLNGIIGQLNNESVSEHDNTEGVCSGNSEFPDDLKKNVAIINNYNFSVPNEYLKYLKIDKKGIKQLSLEDKKMSLPVFVSGISSNHFKEFKINMRTNQKTFLQSFPTMKVIIFDLGLNKDEINFIGQHFPTFDIRRFPFEEFPDHVRRLKGYCWKPIAIQLALKEYSFVYWTDASIITFPDKASILFQRALDKGIQSATSLPNNTVKKSNFRATIAGRTSPILFKTLNENPCLYRYKEVAGGWIVVKRNEFTLKNIMLPWVSCALQLGCMDFPNAGRLLSCPAGGETKVGSCHRFDQSVLGILLTRLFHKNRDEVTFVVPMFGKVNRL